MTELKKWAVDMLIILLVSSIIKFVLPNGNVSKSVKVFLSVTVLAVMLSFLPGIGSYDINIPDFEITGEA